MEATAAASRRADTGPVLVTGAFGLVGSAVVRLLAEQGRSVVATDLDLPANRKAATRLARGDLVRVHWADLTAPEDVTNLLSTAVPSAIVHLAAIIPPLCYRRPQLARAVNVEATGRLLAAAAALPAPPRFVQASSIAVYGARNPHRAAGPLGVGTPTNPIDLYGAHKVEAEALVTASPLEWVVLRLGGVLNVEQRLDVDADMLFFEAALPSDGRIHTVDVRDVARAFAAATTTTATRQIFLVGGDDTHRLRQQDVREKVTAAMGLVGATPPGLPGDPADDQKWFATDWMDTARAQEVLSFQRHSFPDILAEVRARAGWKRHALRLAAPLARRYLRRRAPYPADATGYADLWNVIAARIGDPRPDSTAVGP
jgi:nucleoside-diphosphate-sugar epimerase